MLKRESMSRREAMVIILDDVGSCQLQLGDQQYRGCISFKPKELKILSSLRFRLYPENHLGQDRAISLEGQILAFIKRPEDIKKISKIHLRLAVESITPLHLSFDAISDSSEAISFEGQNQTPLSISQEKPFYSNPFKVINTSINALHPLALSIEHSIEQELDLREFSGVIGTLRQMSLIEVAQGMEYSRKTASIEVQVSNDGKHYQKGIVFVADGQIVHAEYLGIEGIEAVYLMSALNHGTYRVKFARETSKRTINQPTGFILLEAMRRRDEEAAEPFLDLKLDSIIADGDLKSISGKLTLFADEEWKSTDDVHSFAEKTIAEGLYPELHQNSSLQTVERSGIAKEAPNSKVRSLQDGPVPQLDVLIGELAEERPAINGSWDHIFSGFFQEMSDEELSLKPSDVEGKI